MTNQDLKNKLGECTEQLESKLKPFYTSLEPYQRGLLIIGLLLFLVVVTYYLSKPDLSLINKKIAQREKELEERILRQMAFYKKLRQN